MATDVVMPQMGESLAEGTIVRWLKKVGDVVERDEPLLEISTDKVDAEIPSPVAGFVTEIRAGEGETVPVNSVVAVIDEALSQPAAASARQERAHPVAAAISAPLGPGAAPPAGQGGPGRQPSPGEIIRQRSSPLVRRLAKEHNIEISQVEGTGMAGRVTKRDILGFIGGTSPLGNSPVSGLRTRSRDASARAIGGDATGAGLAGQVVPMSVMRKRIAEHMIASRRTSAHVHTVFEVSFSRVAEIREATSAKYERAGMKLSYLPFIVRAAAGALRAVPVANASIEGDNVVYHQDVHIGIAVSLDWGLIVPVIRNADAIGLLDLSRTIAGLADRARSKQLKPEEVSGGTFTITNAGAAGALFGLPIINQPQVAILGVGNIGKRPAVVDDAISIGLTGHLSLGFDHRIIDGAVADEFMSHVKDTLENWDPSDT